MMPIPPAFLLPEHPTFLDNLAYQLTGFGMVLFILIMLSLLIWAVGAIFARTRKTDTAAATAGTPAVTHRTPPPEIIAAITAAVHTLINQPHQIVAIDELQPLAPNKPNLTAWSVEGRRQIFSSHSVR